MRLESVKIIGPPILRFLLPITIAKFCYSLPQGRRAREQYDLKCQNVDHLLR